MSYCCVCAVFVGSTLMPCVVCRIVHFSLIFNCYFCYTDDDMLSALVYKKCEIYPNFHWGRLLEAVIEFHIYTVII